MAMLSTFLCLIFAMLGAAMLHVANSNLLTATLSDSDCLASNADGQMCKTAEATLRDAESDAGLQFVQLPVGARRVMASNFSQRLDMVDAGKVVAAVVTGEQIAAYGTGAAAPTISNSSDLRTADGGHIGDDCKRWCRVRHCDLYPASCSGCELCYNSLGQDKAEGGHVVDDCMGWCKVQHCDLHPISCGGCELCNTSFGASASATSSSRGLDGADGGHIAVDCKGWCKVQHCDAYPTSCNGCEFCNNTLGASASAASSYYIVHVCKEWCTVRHCEFYPISCGGCELCNATLGDTVSGTSSSGSLGGADDEHFAIDCKGWCKVEHCDLYPMSCSGCEVCDTNTSLPGITSRDTPKRQHLVMSLSVLAAGVSIAALAVVLFWTFVYRPGSHAQS